MTKTSSAVRLIEVNSLILFALFLSFLFMPERLYFFSVGEVVTTKAQSAAILKILYRGSYQTPFWTLSPVAPCARGSDWYLIILIRRTGGEIEVTRFTPPREDLSLLKLMFIDGVFLLVGCVENNHDGMFVAQYRDSQWSDISSEIYERFDFLDENTAADIDDFEQAEIKQTKKVNRSYIRLGTDPNFFWERKEHFHDSNFDLLITEGWGNTKITSQTPQTKTVFTDKSSRFHLTILLLCIQAFLNAVFIVRKRRRKT